MDCACGIPAYTQEDLLVGCPEAKRPEDLRERRSALEEASIGIAEGRTVGEHIRTCLEEEVGGTLTNDCWRQFHYRSMQAELLRGPSEWRRSWVSGDTQGTASEGTDAHREMGGSRKGSWHSAYAQRKSKKRCAEEKSESNDGSVRREQAYPGRSAD
jgi:hypothetical protein